MSFMARQRMQMRPGAEFAESRAFRINAIEFLRRCFPRGCSGLFP